MKFGGFQGALMNHLNKTKYYWGQKGFERVLCNEGSPTALAGRRQTNMNGKLPAVHLQWDNAPVTLNAVIRCILYNLHVTHWRGGCVGGCCLKIHLWNKSELFGWVRSSRPRCNFPGCKISVTLSFPHNNCFSPQFFKTNSLLTNLKATGYRSWQHSGGGGGGADFESLNKLSASSPYFMHYLGMAFSLALPLPAALKNVFSSTHEMVIGAVRVKSGRSLLYF